MGIQDNATVLLKENLMEFKALTEKLINAVNNDLSEEVDRLFIDRQVIINNIGKLQYSKDEFTIICSELDITNVSKELDELVLKRREELKEKMNSLKEGNIANKSYANSANIKRSFFSAKI